MTNCIFCKIKDGEIPSAKVWENENFFAFLDINPVNPGHTLLIPKKHVDYLFELDDGVYHELFKAAKEVSVPLKRAVGAKRIGVVVEGFLVPHVHIHLIPINGPGELDAKRAGKADPNELTAIAERIKDAF
ncbi:HIT family protein [Candidatus Micrarchaeota archaeon]|nr:HIT family protein [Candidatus Micrarchaeota archaeon]